MGPARSNPRPSLGARDGDWLASWLRVAWHRGVRVFVAGATGYIGRHAVREFLRRGHDVLAFTRPGSGAAPEGAELRQGQVTNRASLLQDGFKGERFDAVVSCLASRTGGIRDAWDVEHRAQLNLLEAAQQSGVDHFVLLSAICVQRPRLAFQRAKLAFERSLVESGTPYSIVRPTAFFKSLAGQVERVRKGKPFLVFGNGELTRCKPISESDLARFLADCLEDGSPRNVVLPVGGPGPAITGLDQAEMLGRALERPVKVRHVPLALMDGIIGALTLASRLIPSLRDKAEFARIGRYYGTESMLVWDEATQAYSAELTPEYGQDTLEEFYRRVIRDGLAGQELGEHAVF